MDVYRPAESEKGREGSKNCNWIFSSTSRLSPIYQLTLVYLKDLILKQGASLD